MSDVSDRPKGPRPDPGPPVDDPRLDVARDYAVVGIRLRRITELKAEIEAARDRTDRREAEFEAWLSTYEDLHIQVQPGPCEL